jgi:hypothetical protein
MVCTTLGEGNKMRVSENKLRAFENKLGVFKNAMLRRTFGSMTVEKI